MSVGFDREVITPGTEVYKNVAHHIALYQACPSCLGVNNEGLELSEPGFVIQQQPSQWTVGVRGRTHHWAFTPRTPEELDARIFVELETRNTAAAPFKATIHLQKLVRAGTWEDLMPPLIEESRTPWEYSSLYLFDLDGDGDRDVVLVKSERDPLVVYRNTAKPSDRPVKDGLTAVAGYPAGIVELGFPHGKRDTSIGTGFLVAVKNGYAYFLTTHHGVSSNPQRFRGTVLFPSGSVTTQVERVAHDEKLDVALVRMDERMLPPGKDRPLPLSIAEGTAVGDEVETWGFQPQIGLQTAEGYRLPFRHRGHIGQDPFASASDRYVIDIPIMGGASGGPCVHSKRADEVVGMITATRALPMGLQEAHIVGAKALRTFLDAHLPQ